ncbi:MAG: hypothetical protein Q9212_001532 [Teloschistes hypoglaucus]
MFEWCQSSGPGYVRHIFGIIDDSQLAGPANGLQGPAPDDSTGHDNDHGDLGQVQEEDQTSTARKEALRLRWIRNQEPRINLWDFKSEQPGAYCVYWPLGIMHRDLSWGNLGILQEARPKGVILDLDGATDKVSSNDWCQGTICFNAPAMVQLRQRIKKGIPERDLIGYGRIVDIYALGSCGTLLIKGKDPIWTQQLQDFSSTNMPEETREIKGAVAHGSSRISIASIKRLKSLSLSEGSCLLLSPRHAKDQKNIAPQPNQDETDPPKKRMASFQHTIRPLSEHTSRVCQQFKTDKAPLHTIGYHCPSLFEDI